MFANPIQRKSCSYPANQPSEQHGIQPTQLFQDNRPITQTLQTIQANADAYSAAQSTAVVQRVVDLSNAKSTQHHKYAIKPGDDKVLYSLRNAVPLSPMGLYKKSKDKDQNQTPIFKWQPNVRFYSNAEKQMLEGNTADDLKEAHVKGLVAGVDNPTGQQGDKLPTMGMVGKNDCGFFASALRRMIAAERKAMGANPKDPNAPVGRDQVGVGDQMEHVYQGDQNCEHHQATIVAKDGGSLVTLEAHVGKDLQAPQFHIRNGVNGFVHDNDTNEGTVPSRNLGNVVRIHSLNSAIAKQDPMEIEKRNFRDLHAKGDPISIYTEPGIMRTKHHPDRATADGQRNQVRHLFKQLTGGTKILLSPLKAFRNVSHYATSNFDITEQQETADVKQELETIIATQKQGKLHLVAYLLNQMQHQDWRVFYDKVESGPLLYLTLPKYLNAIPALYRFFLQSGKQHHKWRAVRQICKNGETKKMLEMGMTEQEFEQHVDPDWNINVETEYEPPTHLTGWRKALYGPGIRTYVRKRFN